MTESESSKTQESSMNNQVKVQDLKETFNLP